MSAFSTYLLGFVILVLGLALAAYRRGAPLVGIAVGVITATTQTKPRGPRPPSTEG
jgi:predicted GNAT superfamily acetyltransferase